MAVVAAYPATSMYALELAVSVYGIVTVLPALRDPPVVVVNERLAQVAALAATETSRDVAHK